MKAAYHRCIRPRSDAHDFPAPIQTASLKVPMVSGMNIEIITHLGNKRIKVPYRQAASERSGNQRKITNFDCKANPLSRC